MAVHHGEKGLTYFYSLKKREKERGIEEY